MRTSTELKTARRKRSRSRLRSFNRCNSAIALPSALEAGHLKLDRRGRQRLADGAAGLGLLGEFLECLLVDAGNFAFGLEHDLGDLETFPDLVDRNVGGRMDALRLMAGFSKPGGERHRKT